MSETEVTARDWIEAASCTWLHEAQLLVSVLDAAGIQAVIPNEHTLGVQPLYANLVGGVRVLVSSDDLPRAKELLASGNAALETGDQDEPDLTSG